MKIKIFYAILYDTNKYINSWFSTLLHCHTIGNMSTTHMMLESQLCRKKKRSNLDILYTQEFGKSCQTENDIICS